MGLTPNVVVFMTHDTGRHIGPYGRGVETPHLERMAREGVLFESAFCAAPQCSPSRASLLSGLAPHSHGLIGLVNLGFRLAANSYARTLPAILARAGYSTHLFGFQHEGPEARELGYQHVTMGENVRFLDQTCRYVAPLVAEFLQSRPAEPFFAMAGVFETHRAFPPTDTPLDGMQIPPYLPDTPVVRRDVADLNEQVRQVDQAIGQILHALEVSGHAEDTLFIYTTDHGIAFPGAKATLFDPGLEIALLARGPGGFSSGRRFPALVSNLDLLPTILEYCGVAVPEDVQGVSLLSLVRGETTTVHEEIFAELTYHATYDPVRCVRTERYKYLRSFSDRPYGVPSNVDRSPTKDVVRDLGYFAQPRPRHLLFDVRADPLESRNLADDPAHALVLRELQNRLEHWMECTGDPLLAGDIPLPVGAYAVPVEAYEFK